MMFTNQHAIASGLEFDGRKTLEPSIFSQGNMPRMRIAITADPEIPVPPTLYGGIERIVDMLVRGLVARNHGVTLFAHPESEVPCELQPYPSLHSKGGSNVTRNLAHVSQQLRKGHYDVVHSFARLAYLLPILPLRIPKLMSYQRHISPRSIRAGELISRGTLHFTGCSQHLINGWHGKPNFHVVYNGVPIGAYRATCEVPADAPLVYLGRIEHIKGVHLAIKVAQQSGRRLLIAGNIPAEQPHQSYFGKQILPHLEGRNIEYLGPVDDTAKNEILRGAAALLMPLLWDEPFGIVMAEALACGTPVIGLRRGSLPEIINDGMNGFVCDSIEQMTAAVARVSQIDRRQCRKIAEERFSDHVVVDDYERLYGKLLQASRN